MQTVTGSLVYSGQKSTGKRIDSHLEPVPIGKQPAVVSLNTRGCILDLGDCEISPESLDSQKTRTLSGVWI